MLGKIEPQNFQVVHIRTKALFKVIIKISAQITGINWYKLEHAHRLDSCGRIVRKESL